MSTDTLYHYCSSETFTSIIKNRSIWLSSLTLSNDSMEGKLAARTIMRLAEADGLDADSQDRLSQGLSFLDRAVDGLGFCLSKDGDLLSQWRGYADNAQGFSIGFNRAYIDELLEEMKGDGSHCALHEIEYDSNKHEDLVRGLYDDFKKCVDNGAFKKQTINQGLIASAMPKGDDDSSNEIEKSTNELLLRQLALIPFLYKIKSSAFQEEKEHRFVSLLIKNDPGACLFRPYKNKIIPYREIKLKKLTTPIINEIVIGPRHVTPAYVLKSMLKQEDFGDVQLRPSKATYR